MIDLPESRVCNICGVEKPWAECVVIYRKAEKRYYCRPRCKECHNASERGNRREWKRAYLQAWRKKNAALDASYRDTPAYREAARKRAAAKFVKDHDALLIQGRMNRRDEGITIAEARELCARFGRCYPTPSGLTDAGKREVERIRSSIRRRFDKRRRPSLHEIRKMVYDDNPARFVIAPEKQPVPYSFSSKRMKRMQAARKAVRD